VIPLYKRARKLFKKSGLTLAVLKANTIELFSRRDLVIIIFFTILGLGGVFAATLVTVTAPDSQGAGYLAATACDADGVTIDKSVVFNSTTKRYTVTTISISGVDQRYDANGINGCGGKTLELAIPVNGVTTYATWNIPPTTVTDNTFTISAGTSCSRYGTNSATISIDSTLLDKLALTVTGVSTNSVVETDSNLLVKYTLDESNSFSGSGNTVYDLAGTAQNAQIRNASHAQISSTAITDSTGNKYLDISSSQYVWSSAVPNPTSQSIMLWVYLTDNGVIYSELGGGVNPEVSWHDSQIEMVSNTLKFRVWDSNNPILTVNSDYRNGWHLIGYTISPKTSGQNRTLTAYVDGVNVGSNTQLAWIQNNNGSVSHSIGSLDTTHLGVGAGGGSAGDFRFNSFYLYGKALTSAEVLNLYTLTKGCKR
jgi:hypothetical protein